MLNLGEMMRDAISSPSESRVIRRLRNRIWYGESKNIFFELRERELRDSARLWPTTTDDSKGGAINTHKLESKMLSVTWLKNTRNQWLPLPFNFASVSPSPTLGVYIIWHGGSTPRVVRVGQGDVADRLAAHSRDPVITRYAQVGGLYTTWAAVPMQYRDGVERFLADRLSPLVGDRHPAVVAVPVNLPWAA